MIYLKDRRVLFFKPKKTAGTSVEVSLSCNAGAGDIVTPVMPADEATRHEMGGQFPANWAWDARYERLYADRFELWMGDGVLPRRWSGLRRGRLYLRRHAKYINHITPDRVLRRPGSDRMMTDAFVITMCRHPYETVVSYAHHLHADRGGEGDFASILDRAVHHKPLNEAYIFGAREPDFVIRYEHLREDLGTLETRFGLRLLDNLPVTKGMFRSDRRPAADVLSEGQKDVIRKSHARTFRHFGYAP